MCYWILFYRFIFLENCKLIFRVFVIIIVCLFVLIVKRCFMLVGILYIMLIKYIDSEVKKLRNYVSSK